VKPTQNKNETGSTVKKIMHHAEYQAKLKTLSVSQLRYIAQDAMEAAKAWPGSENEGYYWDEMHYALMELKKR